MSEVREMYVVGVKKDGEADQYAAKAKDSVLTEDLECAKVYKDYNAAMNDAFDLTMEYEEKGYTVQIEEVE